MEPRGSNSAEAPERIRRIRELFEAAGAAEGGTRRILLDQECGSDAELRAAVEKLIDADGEEQPRLDRSLVAPPLGAAMPEPGDKVGAYRIVREIGAGGMGTVYLAELEGRRVALKLVRWPFPELARRLEEETRILSRLEHPHIARLLDAGITSLGLPFLVMEYVEGQPIHRFCKEHRLPATVRVELFRQVCDAVRYLHRNLVIHRDLKPANVLVTAEGVVKVVDFGVAKLLDPAFAPAAGVGVTLAPMTPEYASPEQIRGGPISTLTDVFTLGVVLYELLAEVKPFRGGVLEVIERVCREDAPRPSSVTRKSGISRDLDIIVGKAMQKDPERRYASADQLDDDLARWREGRPILARGDSVWYRARKFAGRNKAALAAGVLIAAVLAGGVAGTAREARIAQVERARAEAQAREAEAARIRAQMGEVEARRQSDAARQRLEQLEKLARGSIRAYESSERGKADAPGILAENARESMLALNREGMLEPRFAPLLDAAAADLRSRDLASSNAWKVPSGWQAVAGNPSLYRVGVDREFLYQGKPSLFLRSLAPNPERGVFVFQEFKGARFRGKRVRLSAALRTAGVEGRATLSLEATADDEDSSDQARVDGSTAWKTYDIVMDIPEAADSIRFGLSLFGPGTVWAANFAFREVERSVPLTERKAPRNLDFTTRP